MSDPPICSNPGCGKVCRLSSSGTYKLHCSRRCCAIHNAAKSAEKRKETCIEKYGTEHPIGSVKVRTKIAESVKEKYGVVNVSHVSEVKEKKKRTLIKNYGVDHPLKSNEIKEKVQQTLQDRYGVKHVSYIGKTEDEIALLQDINKIIALNQEFNLYAISQKYNLSDRALREILEKNNISAIHHVTSSFEKDVAAYVSSVCSDIVLSDRKILNGKEIDIYVPSMKLGFECNGAYWHSEIAGGRNKDYHIDKLNLAAESGARIFYIWDYDWYNKRPIVESMISNLFGKSRRIYARQCTIRALSKKEERAFFNQSHIQGFTPSAIAYGLIFDGKVCAAMSFGKSRYDKTIDWELLRFANALNIAVSGGASRLLSAFFKDHNDASLISYSHKHISNGNLYKTLGFTFARTTGPSYYYTKDYKTFANRVTYQKHKLCKLLDNFDPALTEWENMKNNKYDRIWDCGNDVWILKGKQ